MSGTTVNFGIRYPTMNDVVNATDIQNMATDIDSAISQVEAARAIYAKRPSAMVNNFISGLSVAQGVATNFAPDQKIWDTASIATLGSSNLVVGPGLWSVSVTSLNTFGFTTINYGMTSLLLNGSLWGREKEDLNAGASLYSAQSHFCVFAPAGGTLTVQVFWSGTGGPATYDLQVLLYRLRAI